MVPSILIRPELLCLYISVRVTSEVLHLVIFFGFGLFGFFFLYNVISRDVATCEKLEKVLRAEKGNGEQGSHRDFFSSVSSFLQKGAVCF